MDLCCIVNPKSRCVFCGHLWCDEHIMQRPILVSQSSPYDACTDRHKNIGYDGHYSVPADMPEEDSIIKILRGE